MTTRSSKQPGQPLAAELSVSTDSLISQEQEQKDILSVATSRSDQTEDGDAQSPKQVLSLADGDRIFWLGEELLDKVGSVVEVETQRSEQSENAERGLVSETARLRKA